MLHKDSVYLQYKVLKQYYSGLLELQKDSVNMMDVFDDISFNSGRQFTIFGNVSSNCSVHCESFTYDSFCPLPTPFGSMRGTYKFLRDNGEIFEVEVPLFSLVQSKETENEEGTRP
mgnify:CR=1 FL=1